MQRFYTFCIRFLQISSLVLFGILAVSSFFRTAYLGNAYEIVIRLGWDNPLLNLLFLCCFLALLTGIGKLFLRFEKGAGVLLVLSCLWIFGASVPPPTAVPSTTPPNVLPLMISAPSPTGIPTSPYTPFNWDWLPFTKLFSALSEVTTFTFCRASMLFVSSSAQSPSIFSADAFFGKRTRRSTLCS